MIVDNETNLSIFARKYLETLPTSELLRLLDDPSAEVRTLISRILHLRNDQAIFNLMKSWTKSKDVEKREVCAFVLGQLGCQEIPPYPFKDQSKPLLKILINDKNDEVKEAAISACGHLYKDGLDLDLENLIISQADNQNINIRISVAMALVNSSLSSKVMNIYQKYLKENNEVSEWAEVALEIMDIDNENSVKR